MANEIQKSNASKNNLGSFKNFLKFIFLGNGKYWPTTLLFWYFMLFVLLPIIDPETFTLDSGIFIPIGLLTFFIVVKCPPILYFLKNLDLTTSSGSWISLTMPNFTGSIIILGFILLFVLFINWLVVRIFSRLSKK